MNINIITIDELDELFGHRLPMAAAKILFPEKHGLPDDKTVDEVRAELRALSRRLKDAEMDNLIERVRRIGEPDPPPSASQPLKFVGQPVRISVWKTILWRIFRRPFGVWLHVDVVIDPKDPFTIDHIEPYLAGRDRKPEWNIGYTMSDKVRAAMEEAT